MLQLRTHLSALVQLPPRAAAVLICLLFPVLLGFGGCAKENCEKLLKIACDHVAEEDDALFRCQKLTEQAESFTDEQCAESLQLLKESGKLQNLR